MMATHQAAPPTPPDAEAPAVFTIDSGTGGEPQKRASLTLDRASGEIVRWEPFSSYSAGRKLRSILRFAHTGEVAGIIGQTIAGIVSLGACFLVWTGISLALRRLRASLSRLRAVADDPFDIHVIGIQQEPHQRLLVIRIAAGVGLNDDPQPVTVRLRRMHDHRSGEHGRDAGQHERSAESCGRSLSHGRALRAGLPVSGTLMG